MSDIMVLRTLRMREIGLAIEQDRRKEVIRQLRTLLGNEYEISNVEGMVWVKGPLHDLKVRDWILFVLSEGEIGEK